jgi:VanZ family protein
MRQEQRNLACAAGRRAGAGVLVLVFAACAAYGAMLELAQTAIPGRTGPLDDALWNVVGAAAGLPVAVGLNLWLRRRTGGPRAAAPIRRGAR